jgi:hypothetical protein
MRTSESFSTAPGAASVITYGYPKMHPRLALVTFPPAQWQGRHTAGCVSGRPVDDPDDDEEADEIPRLMP